MMDSDSRSVNRRLRERREAKEQEGEELMSKVLRKGEALTTEWQVAQSEQVATDPWAEEAIVVNVSLLVADHRTRDGFNHVGGARRVEAVNAETGKSFKRPQSFYGETAWSDADRAYGDVVSEVRYAR